MVTTRSSSKKSPPDPDDPPKSTPKKNSAQANIKRKRNPSTAKESPSKRAKKEQSSEHETSAKSDKIIINRAPVLELWGASVAHFTYPNLPWETCISIGSAISTICAVAKGRSIGAISEKDKSEQKQKKRDEAKKNQKTLDEVEVMHFKLKLKDGLAIVGSEQKGKPVNEDKLKVKFGDENYQAVRRTFEQALQNWKDTEDDLNKHAFGFYEHFRPYVSPGQKGWGRKGELDLDKVKKVIHK